MPAKTESNPTSLAYAGLDSAHAFFNSELFGGTLTKVTLSIQRHPKSLGYFSANRIRRAFKDVEKFSHEIAINPMHVEERTPELVLSTLVHEMVHQWQEEHGKKPTRCYHDKQWAARMKEVGLYPSHTGLPGGKEVGPKMTHYIVADGPFARACARFLKDNDLSLVQDRAFEILFGKKSGAGKDGDEGEGEGDDEKKKSTGRTRWMCPGCELKVLAKPSARLRCEDCDMSLVDRDAPEKKEKDDV